MKVRTFADKNYKGIYFNGKTVRIALDPSKPISELDYPEFYDVKITSKCDGDCPYCYMDSKSDSPHAVGIVHKIHGFFGTMSDNEKPFQVAIGGGEPTMHPEFLESLSTFDALGITPNYTTNGIFASDPALCDDIIDSTKEYCGGVAVSCHEHLDLQWSYAAALFAEADIKLNFHLIISDKESIDRFVRIFEEWKERVEYFVLLPYGAQGRAVAKDIEWEYLMEQCPDDHGQIAFGANFYTNLSSPSSIFDVSLYEPESMSKFLDLEDMKVYPSSFHLEAIEK